ncbi:diaminopimelate decarboxylase, partial [Pseudonocardia abyssalis]
MTLADLIPALRTSLSAKLEPGLWPETARAHCDGSLDVGGVDLSGLAARFGTPVVAVDTTDVRSRVRTYRDALPGVEIAYAGKAFLCRGMARLVDQEGLTLDVCSGGEVAVAAAAGFPGERMVLHGNVKAPEDLKAAFAAGVGRVVIDSLDEIAPLAASAPRRQRVLLRVVPGLDGDTHAALTTGNEDQGVGLSITTGAAAEAVRRILDRPELELVGVHCHIGSQVRSVTRCASAAARSIAFLGEIAREHGVLLGQLDLGGGHAVGWTAAEPGLSPGALARTLPAVLANESRRAGIPVPRLTVEPGRAIVARAGVTVYRVCAVKRGVTRTFVAVDGGMSDNPRPALYGVRYPVRLVGRPATAAPAPVTVVGRHCESSDVLAEDVLLPGDVAVGDLLVVPCSGAYHVSLSSNYNHVGRPPVVAVAGGAALP